MGNFKSYFEKPATEEGIENRSKTSSFKSETETILLIDSDGLSHYTCYLAYGLSKYRDIILYGFSNEYYLVTGAARKRRIKFYDVRKKLPKRNTALKLIVEPIILFLILLDALRKSKYDIVHIQGYLPMFFLFIPMLKLKRKKIFWTMHDSTVMPSYKSVRGKLELFYTNATTQPGVVTRYADKIIVHAKSLKQQLEASGVDSNKIHVVPHFDYRYLLDYRNNNQINNQTENKIMRFTNSKFGRNYILFFGHITPYKGIDVLINAAKIVNKQTQNNNIFNILIAGRGDLSYFNHLLKEEDYEYMHIYNDYITSSDIPDLVSGSRFLVLPYTNIFKSQSGVIPLAYTFSKPVIVSNIASLTEYVEHNKTGFVFECGDSTQLAHYMMELLENRARCTEMGKCGYQKVVREMSLETCCKILNDIYESSA